MNFDWVLALSIINLILIIIAIVSLLRQKRLVNFWLAMAIVGIGCFELSKIFHHFLFYKVEMSLVSAGFSISSLFWLIASISFLPSKKYSTLRIILSPILGIIIIVFMVLGWINQFFSYSPEDSAIAVSILGRYFFVFVIFASAFILSNFERSYYHYHSRRLFWLLVSLVFILLPLVVLATYGVLFSLLPVYFIRLSSWPVLLGILFFLSISGKTIISDDTGEDVSVYSSVVLFLLGGYLFLVAAFIKLFQAFGWNLHTLFSFLTTLFIFVVFMVIIMSSSLKERMRSFLLRYLGRYKYDWQSIWEEFTYKISLATDEQSITQAIKESVEKLIGVSSVEVVLLESNNLPFEEEFADWMLRKAELFFKEELVDGKLDKKFPLAYNFLQAKKVKMAAPLYGNRQVLGMILFSGQAQQFIDKELLKVIALQSSSVILAYYANQALREAEKRESLHRMASLVVHDLRNYVNTLSLLISNKDKLNHPQFQQDMLHSLDYTIKRMTRLMEQFQSLRGNIELHKEEIDLVNLIKEMVKSLTISDNIDLELNLPEKLTIYADRMQLERVLMNLIRNASQAIESKGKITIEVNQKEDNVLIKVKDTGKGIAENILNKLFRPFVTTKKQGMGVGLYLSKMIIEAHRGKIKAKSVVGQGSEFVISLPV